MISGPSILFYVAGVQGLEPRLTVPETAVLPLDDTPRVQLLACSDSNTTIFYILYQYKKLFIKKSSSF